MKTLSATAARRHFAQLIEAAQYKPVLIQRRGRDVAVVMSPQEYRRLRVAHLHAESASRWASVYEALAR
jgi:prevent-host-death family protein